MYSDTLLRVKMESVKIKKNSYGFTLDNLMQKNHTFNFYTILYKVSEYINATIVSILLNSSLKWWQTKSSRCAQSQNPSARTYTQKTERLAVGCLNGCSHTESWSHVKGLCCLAIINPSKLWARCLVGYIYTYLGTSLSLPS